MTALEIAERDLRTCATEHHDTGTPCTLANCTLARRVVELERDELPLWRRLLAFRHGCPTTALYGDDGEMQCNKCGVDFRRMTVAEIEQTWMTQGERMLREALAAAEDKP